MWIEGAKQYQPQISAQENQWKISVGIGPKKYESIPSYDIDTKNMTCTQQSKKCFYSIKNIATACS